MKPAVPCPPGPEPAPASPPPTDPQLATSSSEDDPKGAIAQTDSSPPPPQQDRQRPQIPPKRPTFWQRPTLSGKRKYSKAVDKTGPPPSREQLRSSAGWWRSLQCIGMNLHFLAPPRPPSPSFTRTISSTIAEVEGTFDLQFYLPAQYNALDAGARWPVVVNYHGGGFTIGNASDDARFARFVVETAGAVFVSVAYRLAPEYPFPTAVDDGADAILHVARNAAEYRIDPLRIATSGFSAGGNVAITAPIRIEQLRRHEIEVPGPAEMRIVAVAAWYPITDYTLTRAQRRASAVRPDQTLSPTLTTLFDASYLYPPELNLADPCLSPSKAPDELLRAALPRHILFYTCGLDMLLYEGQQLVARLKGAEVGKSVHYNEIHGVAHGWDKGPNPLRPPKKSEKLYGECTRHMKRIFEEAAGDESDGGGSGGRGTGRARDRSSSPLKDLWARKGR